MSSSQSGQAKSFLFYCAVLLVAGSSVVFGLDWTQAPLPPMPETEATVQAAKLAAKFPPPVVRTAKVEPQPVIAAPARPSAQPSRRVAAVAPAARAGPSATAAPTIVAPERNAAQPETTEQPKCDIAACSAAYRSFRASDCTWQPYEGPRRFCDKGNPPQDVAAATPADQTANVDIDQPVVSDKCDIEACKRAYFTFTPEDCTYQPSNGPRRLCTKGNPPKPNVASTDPAKAAADAANAATKTDQAAQPVVSNKCDIEACKRAYFTFTPEDCTYQPSDGPRRLCTKGNPPKADTSATDPAKAAADAANAATKSEQAAGADQAKPDQANPDQAKPKCNIEACREAYFSFTPEDCTYQPTNGPRRLCTK
jgi:hypothetical protein